MEKSIFDVMADCSVNERMDDLLLRDERYREIQDKIEEQREKFYELHPTKEQCRIVDRLLSSHTESGAVYGKMAYRQGFRDCAALLLEMKLLKAA